MLSGVIYFTIISDILRFRFVNPGGERFAPHRHNLIVSFNTSRVEGVSAVATPGVEFGSAL